MACTQAVGWFSPSLPEPAGVNSDIPADTSGRAWNHSAAAGLLGDSCKTVQRYVQALKGAYAYNDGHPANNRRQPL